MAPKKGIKRPAAAAVHAADLARETSKNMLKRPAATRATELAPRAPRGCTPAELEPDPKIRVCVSRLGGQTLRLELSKHSPFAKLLLEVKHRLGCEGTVRLALGTRALPDDNVTLSLEQLGIDDGAQLACITPPIHDEDRSDAEEGEKYQYDAGDHELVDDSEDSDGEKIPLREYYRRRRRM